MSTAKAIKPKTTWPVGLEIAGFALFLVVLMPIFLVLINASKDVFAVTNSPLALPEDWSLLWTNITNIWFDENIRYQSSFFSSLIITLASLLFINLLSAQAAWVMARTQTKTSKIIFLVLVASMVIPFQIVMLPLVTWFRSITVTTGIPLLRSYWGIILAYIGFGTPISIFMYHGFVKGIPLELEEAASIDGCSGLQTFYLVVFPILKPIHATVAILNGIWIWNDYLLPLIVLGKGNQIMTVPLAVANFAGAFVKQWDFMLAAVLMAMIPVIIAFLFAQKYIVRGMTAGSIK